MAGVRGGNDNFTLRATPSGFEGLKAIYVLTITIVNALE